MIEMLIYDKKTNACQCGIRDTKKIAESVRNKDNILWLDIENPTVDDMAFLEHNFNFHPLSIEDCMATIQRPKIDNYSKYLFIVLHAASLDVHKDKATSLELDTFLGDNYLVTVHVKPMKSIAAVIERCYKNKQIIANGPAHIFYNVADSLADNYYPILDKVDKDIEMMELKMFTDHTVAHVNKILSLKEAVLVLRRYLVPQRELVNVMVRGDFHTFFPSELTMYFRDLSDHMTTITDTLDSYRDILTSVLEGYTSVASNRLSEVMKVLTIITTIIMPLSLISGIYGMNFKHMPELEWQYGYYVAIGLMLCIGFAMFLYFKHKKWV